MAHIKIRQQLTTTSNVIFKKNSTLYLEPNPTHLVHIRFIYIHINPPNTPSKFSSQTLNFQNELHKRPYHRPRLNRRGITRHRRLHRSDNRSQIDPPFKILSFAKRSLLSLQTQLSIHHQLLRLQRNERNHNRVL